METTQEQNNPTHATISKQLSQCPILIYMKGSPEFPQCGFSARAVQILAEYKLEFAYVDVLQNPDIRRELPSYSAWPTFPQVFISGELIGGCDLVTELHERGELKAKLEQAVQAARAADQAQQPSASAEPAKSN